MVSLLLPQHGKHPGVDLGGKSYKRLVALVGVPESAALFGFRCPGLSQ
jgi:hypothetical protein